MEWSWACAKVIGSAHVKRNQKCQDAFFCFTEGEYLITAVADGAGSALRGGLGANYFCRALRRSLQCYFSSCKSFPKESDMEFCLLKAKYQLLQLAHIHKKRPRDFATTVILVVSNGQETLTAHVGDGGAALKDLESNKWICPTWPFKGPYASSTSFVTDIKPELSTNTYGSPIDGIAIFSDGLEKLILNFQEKTASSEFLDPITQPLSPSPLNHNREFSKQIRAFLSSDRVLQRTDDDKTIVLARRPLL